MHIELSPNTIFLHFGLGNTRSLVTGTVARPMGRQASTGVVEDHGKLEILGGGCVGNIRRVFRCMCCVSHLFGNLVDRCAYLQVKRHRSIIGDDKILGAVQMPTGRRRLNAQRYSYTMEYHAAVKKHGDGSGEDDDGVVVVMKVMMMVVMVVMMIMMVVVMMMVMMVVVMVMMMIMMMVIMMVMMMVMMAMMVVMMTMVTVVIVMMTVVMVMVGKMVSRMIAFMYKCVKEIDKVQNRVHYQPNFL